MIGQALSQLTTLLLTLTVFASSPVRLTLRVEPSAELPGIPVTLHVEALNTSDAVASIPNSVAMQVTPGNGGAPFVAVAALRGEAGDTSFPGVSGSEIQLAPRERRDLTIWSALDVTLLTQDRRLFEPGEYRLRLFIDPALPTLDYLSVGALSGNEQLVDPIVSNEAVLTVLTPTGDDAAVFALIKSLNDPRGWPVELAERIWSEHPHSRYAPYAVPSNLADRTRQAALLRAAINKAPTSLIADWHRLYLADISNDFGSPSNEDELRRALAAAEYVGPLLEDLVKRARDPRVLVAARKMLAAVPSSDELVRYMRINRGELTDVEPEVVCTSSYANGRFVAWLSYYNPARTAKVLQVGERNKFTPPPFDRGQPTEFRPSYRPGLFKVVFTSPTGTWHVDNANLRIDPKKAPRVCPADMDEFYNEYYRGSRDWPEDAAPR